MQRELWEKAAARRRGKKRHRSTAYIAEAIEPRTLLTSAIPIASPPIISMPVGSPIITPLNGVQPPFSPANIVKAYGLDQVSFTGDPALGGGQTIAIVDAYDDPNIQTDVGAFDTHFGLPALNDGGPTFKVLNEYGNASPLPPTTGSVDAVGWDTEISLDVEWAHSIAPGANIVLFEANSNTADLYTAVQTAAQYSGVSVVSMSWGGDEFSEETSVDSYFTTPLGHAGVTFIASSGDNGAGTEYPAASPNVLSVGGTSLTLGATGNYSSESGWSGSGGGVSPFEAQPTYQQGAVNNVSSTKRAVPDVSWLANPDTGVSVVDTYNAGNGASNNGFIQVGGTSLAAPMWAGLIAIVDQGRALQGQSSLTSTQTLLQLYQLGAGDFRDITSGNSGYAATSGYDLVTGLGTPIAQDLVPAMLSEPNPAQSLLFETQPSDVTSGATLSPSVVVYIRDTNGIVVPTDFSDVTISLGSNPGGATLSGTTTVQAVNGVATFTNLSLDKAGAGYTLVVTDGALQSSTSNMFDVVYGAPAKVVFLSTPANGAVNTPIGSNISVAVEDAAGNVVLADSTDTVQIGVSGNPYTEGANSMSATVTNGVATFSAPSFTQAGTFELTASAGLLQSGESAPFTISPATPFVDVAATGETYDGQPFGATNALVYDGATTATIASFGDSSLSYVYYAGAFANSQELVGQTPLNSVPVAVGAYTVVATFAGDSNYLMASSAPVSYTIISRTLDVLATGSDKSYDGTYTASVTLSDDRVTGDDLTISYQSANFTSKDAGASVPIDVTGLSLTGASAGNYVLASTTVTTAAAIKPLYITPTIAASNKPYDGTTAATFTYGPLVGVLRGDSVSLAGGVATFNSKDVASADLVTATGLSLAGPQSQDYVLSNPAATAAASITPIPVTGTITANNKVYDQSNYATLASETLNGVLPADNAYLTGSDATFNSASVTSATTVTATNLAIAGLQASDYTLTNPTESAPASILPRPLTGSVTVASRYYNGSASATITNYTVGVTYSNDSVWSAGGNASFSQAAPGSNLVVTATNLTLAGPQASDYVLTNPTETTLASIAPIGISGTVFDDASDNGVFGGADAGLAGRTVTLRAVSTNRKLSTKTDANGNFTFSNLSFGTYVVKVVLPAHWKSTTPLASGDTIILQAGPPVASLTFGQTNVASVSGSVFLDADQNGRRDPSDSGLSGWTVQLAPAGSNVPAFTTTTDSNGDFAFLAVPVGNYTLSVVDAAGYSPSPRGHARITLSLTPLKAVTGADIAEQLGVGHRRGGHKHPRLAA